MDAQRCLEMLREIKDCAFATVDENGVPQVRMIDVMLVEDGALCFCTCAARTSTASSRATAAWRSRV